MSPGNRRFVVRRARHRAVVTLFALVLGLSAGVTTPAGAAISTTASGTNTPGTPSDGRSVQPSDWRPHGTCRGAFGGLARGSLVKTTSAGPSGGTVVPGQKITVTLTWKPADFSGNRPFLIEDCVRVGSRISTTLSQVQVPGSGGGTETFSYVVPPGGTGGQPICDRAVAAGFFDPPTGGWGGDGGWSSGPDDEGQQPRAGDNGGDRDGDGGRDGPEKSAVLCYSILAAATPEVSSVLFLPVAALVVCGGALFAFRRREGNAARNS